MALLGLGTVGGGVRALLESMPDRFEIVRIAVRDTVGRRGPLTTDGFAAATCGADVVVEAIGGIEPARSAVAAALAAGSHVVTANKALLAADGVRLQRIAATHGRVLCGAAAVGGSVPVLERLAALGPRVVRVRGIVNGTCNFVLDRIARGVPYDVALTDARNRGLAECDPARDLDGRDSADKLAVMARTLAVDLDEPVSREAITAAVGGGVRQVATLDVAARCGRVELTPLAPSDPLLVPGAGNAVEITLDDGSRELLRGRGAGRWATAESVVGELLDLGRPSRRVRCSA